MIEITEITADNKADLNKANQPFDIIGRLNIKFENGRRSCTKVLFDAVKTKQYPNYDAAEDYTFLPIALRILHKTAANASGR